MIVLWFLDIPALNSKMWPAFLTLDWIKWMILRCADDWYRWKMINRPHQQLGQNLYLSISQDLLPQQNTFVNWWMRTLHHWCGCNSFSQEIKEVHRSISFLKAWELLCLGGNVELFLNLLLQVFDVQALRDVKFSYLAKRVSDLYLHPDDVKNWRCDLICISCKAFLTLGHLSLDNCC